MKLSLNLVTRNLISLSLSLLFLLQLYVSKAAAPSTAPVRSLENASKLSRLPTVIYFSFHQRFSRVLMSDVKHGLFNLPVCVMGSGARWHAVWIKQFAHVGFSCSERPHGFPPPASVRAWLGSTSSCRLELQISYAELGLV